MARTRRVPVVQPAEVVATAPVPRRKVVKLPKIAVTVQEAAVLYSLSEKVIRSLIARGTLRAIKPAGVRAYIILVADLEAALAPRFHEPPPREESEDQRIDRVQRAAGIA